MQWKFAMKTTTFEAGNLLDMCKRIDPFSDNDIDHLFEDALLDNSIGNNIN